MSRPFLWEAFIEGDRFTERFEREAHALPAIRRGVNALPGEVPGMWPYYVKLNENGFVTRDLQAEHVCLVTYAFHQQSERYPVHRAGVGLGQALRELRASDKFSQDAIDAHVARLATADQINETAHHLRALTHRMKASKKAIVFDYTRLFFDLVGLQDEQTAGRVRRRWGAAYFSTSDTQGSES
ncbi:MAG: type I-E CRISPR-associated protein Cse2/CasB [Actinomycetales bacterium]|nr:type I-E CRISPR-associated protein Cse2/CasB [Actinomycetales bacterium]